MSPRAFYNTSPQLKRERHNGTDRWQKLNGYLLVKCVGGSGEGEHGGRAVVPRRRGGGSQRRTSWVATAACGKTIPINRFQLQEVGKRAVGGDNGEAY